MGLYKPVNYNYLFSLCQDITYQNSPRMCRIQWPLCEVRALTGNVCNIFFDRNPLSSVTIIEKNNIKNTPILEKKNPSFPQMRKFEVKLAPPSSPYKKETSPPQKG